ncbi:MAG TPA: SRPBCC family protein [Candidatus Eisenbacteria bacterium]|nr:SRPBCC family protein [Candidatus Eisenbacteria bacterium]
MKTYRLDAQIWLPQPRDLVFGFFADPRNLERITPPWLQFAILSRGTVEMKTGARLDYKLRLHGIPIRWQSEIASWDPPRCFVDRQTRGPYSLWVHRHLFTETNQGTLVGDHVEYAVPGGRLVQRFFVAPDLKRIFQYRQRALEEIFTAPGPGAAG